MKCGLAQRQTSKRDGLADELSIGKLKRIKLENKYVSSACTSTFAVVESIKILCHLEYIYIIECAAVFLRQLQCMSSLQCNLSRLPSKELIL